MKLDFAARVDIGPLQTNDDRVLINGQIISSSCEHGQIDVPAVVAVCDGCGGYSGGYVAAQTVLEFLSYETPADLTDPNYLAQVLENCKQMVFEKKQELPQYAEMCTTVAGCVFHDDGILFFHAGDSRVYRYDGWSLAKMTRDHSLVQSLVDAGQITPEEALTSPKRNVINRCIGFDCPAPEIYVSRAPVNAGEKYLFCSDGLWETVSDRKIKEVLDSDKTLQEMADELVNYALRNGADDNVSVCICAHQHVLTKEKETPFILE